MAKQPKHSLATFPLIVTWVVLTVVVMKVHGDFNQTKELYRQLFSDTDNRIHPSLNTSVPKDVFVQVNLLSLREIVEREQYFVINAWIEITWKDEIRSWDPSQYDGVRVVYPGPTDMWKPRLIVSNSVDKRDLFEDDYAPFSLFWDGSAYWLPGTVFALSCTMDMTYFPLDRQSCSLLVLAQQFALDVNLIPALPTANTAGYSQNGEWHLDSTSVTPR
ncbi:acetylcholine receptor subunit gamma [Plakobranchus ocellatus]|uniref:Acetylcholine receptor subunit gamma n=1 Tax=Plakobranchus ocellatus TaxID=259542 RepID=A0AAV3YES0_9GAST|nr:acetylcholine receptor subunit gamma [Plakobranchus ocellatus]